MSGAPTIVLYPGGHPLLHRVAEELRGMGLRVEIRGAPDCGPGRYNIGPRPPPHGCAGARVPHPGLVPDLVRTLLRRGLWGDPDRALHEAVLARLRSLREDYEPAFRAGGLGMPSRPPPVLVAGEVYARGGPDTVCARADRLRGEGADLVVLGLDCWSRECRRLFLDAVEACAERHVVFADPGDTGLMLEALSLGAHGGMSIRPGDVGSLPGWARDAPLVVLAEGSPGEAVRAARRLSRPILDPVLRPLVYPGLWPSLERLARLSRVWSGPIMAGVNNVYELLDADPSGSIGVLVPLVAELGASVVLATEESPKAYGAVMLARLAADLASLSLYYGSPPKDYPVRLLLARHKRLPVP